MEKPVKNVFLGEPGTEQFEVHPIVNGHRLRVEKVHDPFVSTTVCIDWRDLLRGLWLTLTGRGPFTVNVFVFVGVRPPSGAS